jgi:hypothetical protein
MQLSKKILRYYKCKPEDIPPAIYSEEGMKQGLYKQFFLYPEDYKNNVNVQTELINVKSVKCFTPFDYDEEFKGIQGREYLMGGNTRVLFNDNTSIVVTESIHEIASKTGTT